jgi:small-conductance mechanosensitive channel
MVEFARLRTKALYTGFSIFSRMANLPSQIGFVFSPLFSKLVLAVFILLLGFIAGRVIGLLVKRFLAEIQFDKHLRNIGIKMSLERLVAGALSFVIYAFTVFLTLDTLGLTSTIVTIILIGIVFVVVVSFLLAIRDFFPNLLSGLRIRFMHLFEVGDEVQIKEVKGRITSISLLETRLVTSFKEEIIIPNALFIKRKIIRKKKN